MISTVDQYLIKGCMRCKYGDTPQCKVHRWKTELQLLRQLVLECGLVEEVKWGIPCYTFEGKNVLTVSAFKEHAALSFFKGILLKDSDNLLTKRGENTHASRDIQFVEISAIEENFQTIKAYVVEAIEIEKQGKKVPERSSENVLPKELLDRFAEDPALKQAFYDLTPGRQRGYSLHFSQPKKSETRTARIDKKVEQIMMGIGLHDRI